MVWAATLSEESTSSPCRSRPRGCARECGVTFGHATVEVTYTTGIETSVVSGGGEGVVTGPLEMPLVVRLRSLDTETTLEGKPVDFKITTQPPNATEASVGEDESATALTYRTHADAEGLARAILVLGSREGTYEVEAISPLSATNVPATFTATATKPDHVRIVTEIDGEEVGRSSYVVTPWESARFRAVGYTPAGFRIGPMKTAWSASGSGPSGGQASLDPSTNRSETTFTPVSPGIVKLSANPSVSGINTARAEVLIGGVFLDANGSFTPDTPRDDLPRWVPGSTLSGASMMLPSDMADPIQMVKLHVLNGRNRRGSVTFRLTEVSNYPGIAMNYPIENPQLGPDLDFGPEADGTCADRQCITVPFADSGDTSATLYVRDYAARGKLNARITVGQDTYEQVIRLPRDDNQNLLPDIGWYFVNRAPDEYRHVAEETLDRQHDSEAADPPGVPLPDPLTGTPKTQGITGDGLTALEEYRGFVVEGRHRRTNPHRKDLFVRIDKELLIYDDVFLSLPLTFHYILLETDEVQADSNGLHPLVNFNRDTTMSGASNQYALRIRERVNAPTVIDSNAKTWPAYQFLLGRHFRVGADVNTIYFNEIDPIATPNETLVVELYPRAFGNEAITHAPGQPLASTPPCIDVTLSGCDEYDPIADEIRPGQDQVLDTVRRSPDLGVELLTRCGGGHQYFIDATHAAMRTATLAHEAAHGLLVDHVEYYMSDVAACGQSVMYSVGTMSPIPTQYLIIDKQQLRIHAKHP